MTGWWKAIYPWRRREASRKDDNIGVKMGSPSYPPPSSALDYSNAEVMYSPTSANAVLNSFTNLKSINKEK